MQVKEHSKASRTRRQIKDYQVTMRIPSSLKEQAYAMAESLDMSFAEFGEEALRHALSNLPEHLARRKSRRPE